MFSLVSGIFDWYFKKPSLNLLIIGDESSGKTTFLEKIKEEYLGKRTPQNMIISTSGLNRKYNNYKL